MKLDWKTIANISFDQNPWHTTHKEIYDIAVKVQKLCFEVGVPGNGPGDGKSCDKALEVLDMLQTIVDRELKREP